MRIIVKRVSIHNPPCNTLFTFRASRVSPLRGYAIRQKRPEVTSLGLRKLTKMKKTLIALAMIAMSATLLKAQIKPYTTSSGELIFSMSNYDGGTAVRFSPVVNVQNMINFDRSETLG